jgi:hypothetical protein
MPLNPDFVGAVQNIEISQVENLPKTLDEKQEVITPDNPILIQDVNNLQTELNLKANQTDLNTEIQNRTDADGTLQNNIEQLQTILDTETLNRVNADITLQENIDLNAEEIVSLNTLIGDNVDNLQAAIALKLDEANSIHRENYAFYCVDGRNDLHSVLPNVNNQGAYISISSGSFGNTDPLTIDKNNISLFGIPSTPPLCEFFAAITIPSTANRIRTRYMSFDGVCNLNGKRCVYTHSTFNDNVNIGEGTTEYMTFSNCEFSAANTITFSSTMASVVYVIECNIAGANLVFNNASPLQVIFSNCSGFVSLPTTSQATLVGLNVKADGSVVQHNISKIVLPTGEGENNQVLTSTGSGNCIWTTPSGGGGGSDIIKEKIYTYVRGQTISTLNSGDITLPPLLEQTYTNAILYFTDIASSVISYCPPAGTTTVIYEYSFQLFNDINGMPEANQDFLYEFLIDDVIQVCSRTKTSIFYATKRVFDRITFKIPIEITGTDDATTAQVATWTTNKTLKLRGKQLLNGITYLHKMYSYGYFPPQGSGQSVTPVPSIISITAF